MATDTREDAGQYYPGGDVIPTRPMPSGGGGTIVLDDTVTQSSSNGVKSSGIWAWVKGLLPNWLTSSYAEPATVASVNAKLNSESQDGTGSISWSGTEVDTSLKIEGPCVNACGILLNSGGGITEVSEINGISVPSVSEETFAVLGDLATKQNVIEVSGILKGDGEGGVSAAVAGTDYQSSLAYSATSSYVVGAPCIYQNALYTCKTAIASGEAWNAAHWQKVADFISQHQDISGKVNKSGDAMTGDLTVETQINIHSSNGILTYDNSNVETKINGSGFSQNYGTFLFNLPWWKDLGVYDLATTDDITAALAAYLLITKLAPAYSATSAYSVGDFCSYNGTIYQCTTAIAAPGEAWNAAHWAQRNLSSLFSRVDTLTPVSVAGVLNNAELEKSIVKAVSSNFTDADTTSY